MSAINRRAALALFFLMPLFLAVTRAGADIAIVLIGALFLLNSLLEKNWQWLKRKDIQTMAALWAYMLIASLFAEARAESLTAALIWGRLWLFYAAATAWLLADKRTLSLVWKITLPIIALLLIDTYWQYFTGTSLSGHGAVHADRLNGPLSHPNIGNLLLKISLPVFGLLAYELLEAGKRRTLCIAGAIGIAIVALIPITGERSSTLLMLIGLAAAGGVCFLCRPALRKYVLSAAAAMVVLIGILAATQTVVAERGLFLLQQLSTFWQTCYGQLYIAAFHFWQAHPLIGIGVNHFRSVCLPDAKTMAALGVTYCDMHPHNMYMEWLADTGLIGLGLFVLAMALAVRRTIKAMSFRGNAYLLAAFACATLAVLLFPFMVTQSVFSNWPGVLFWYSLSLAASLPRMAHDQ